MAGASRVAAATAAAAVLVLTTMHPTTPSQDVDSEAAEVSTLSTPEVWSGEIVVQEPSALGLETVLETREAPFTYRIPGLADVRVAPGSALRVMPPNEAVCADGTRPMTVALLRGSLHADVVPNADCETFAVEVDHTRIAVHGTSFDVTRESDRALVEVRTGAIAVGPVTHRGTTQGWLVTAPDRASFSLNGARQARWLAPLEQGGPGRTELAGLEQARPSSPLLPVDQAEDDQARQGSTPQSAGSDPSSPPAQIGIGANSTAERFGSTAARQRTLRRGGAVRRVASAVESFTGSDDRGRTSDSPTVRAIVEGIRACYRKQLAATQVQFSVHSTLTLVVSKTGAIDQGVFRPPLSPTLMPCAAELIRAVRFMRSESRSTLRLPIDLTP